MKRLLAVAFTACFISFAKAEDFRIGDLSAGMHSNPSANKIPDNSATRIQNFYTDIENTAVERNGFVTADSAVLGGTMAVSGVWSFTDSGGSEWLIRFSSRTYYKNLAGETPTVLFTSTVDQIPDAAVNLGKFWAVNGVDDLKWFDGTSTGTVATAPKGRLITPWRNRLVIGNITGSQSTIHFSEDGDGTNWTLGGDPTDPFTRAIGGANDGQYVRCLETYQDSLVIGRKTDIHVGDGFDGDDLAVREVSRQVGCLEPRTMKESDGGLIWLSNRGVDEMRGRDIQLISEPVRDITDRIVKNSANERSNTQTTEEDWAAGTIGASTEALSTTIFSGSVVLSTGAAQHAGQDNIGTNFSAGTLTDLMVVGNTIALSTTSDIVNKYEAAFTQLGGWNDTTGIYQQFTAAANYATRGVEVYMQQDGSVTVGLYSDSGGSWSTLLASGDTPTGAYSGQWIPVTWNVPVSLTSGTAYWIAVLHNTNCSTPGSNKIVYGNNSSSVSGTFMRRTSIGCSPPAFTDTVHSKNMAFRVLPTYETSGNIVSRVFNVGVSTTAWLWEWGTLTSDQNTSTGTISWETQTSSDGVTWGSLTALSTGAAIPSAIGQYLRYKASFTGSGMATPYMSSVTLHIGPRVYRTGAYTSQLITVGGNITNWGPVTIEEIVSGGTINYEFGSNASASTTTISNWTAITNGQTPTVSTNSYAAFRATFSASVSTADVRTSAFVTTWNEGSLIPEPIAHVYDRRYWLAYTTSTASSPFLDSVLVFQRNRSWTLFQGIYAAAFSFWRDALYFGNSVGNGYTYKYDVGNNDDGEFITSIIETKSYDMGRPHQDKSLRNLYVSYAGSSEYTGTLGMSVGVDRMGLASIGSADLNEGTGLVRAKFPLTLSSGIPQYGREIQFRLEKSGVGDRLKLHDLIFEFETKEAR